MTENHRVAFFDGIAELWDGWEDLPSLSGRLAAAFLDLGLGPDERVADVGCGTGNLTSALLAHLSPRGRVLAVDISPRMVEVARGKIEDERVTWLVGDVTDCERLPAGLDRVLCFSVWPHLDDPVAAARRLFVALRPGGALHVWHLASRDKINEIHRGAGAAVRDDVLAPGEQTAEALRAAGFHVSEVIDDESRYLVTGLRPAV